MVITSEGPNLHLATVVNSMDRHHLQSYTHNNLGVHSIKFSGAYVSKHAHRTAPSVKLLLAQSHSLQSSTSGNMH